MAGETVIGALRYDFTADTSGLKSGLAEVTNSLKKVTDQVRSNSREFEQHGQQAAKSIGLAKHEMLNLTRQLNDVGVSLAGGMSPFMVLTQQGGQIADIFQQSGASVTAVMRQIAAEAAKSLLSIRAISYGVAGAVVGIGAAALSSVRHLETLSDTARALGTNRNALNELNRQGGLFGLDPAKMNEELLALAQQLQQAKVSGGDLADKLAAIGINIKNFDLAKAGEFARLFEQIAEKIRNGGNELDKLNALKLLGLSGEFSRFISQGGGALEKFAADSARTVESTTKTIEEKWRELRTFFSNLWKAIVDTAIDYLWQLKQVSVSIVDAIASAFETLAIKVKGYLATAKLYYGIAKEAVGMQESGQADKQYKADTAGLGRRLVMARGSSDATELPPISVGSGDLSIFSKTGADKKSSAKSATDQVKNYIDSLREAAGIAQAEVDNWSKGNVEREKAMALVKAENIAKQEGKALTQAQREEILALAGQQEAAKQKVDELKYAQDRLNDAMQQFAGSVADSLDALIVKGQKASDVMRNLISQLASAALKGLLTGEGMFGKVFGMEGSKEGGLGGLFGKALALMPKFAAGGTLGAGRWGIAGEAGPELVKGPASIVPFDKMGGQGGNVTIHNYAGADVQASQNSNGEWVVIVQKMIEANNAKVPGILANSQRRSM